jgi:hypothetical protein
VIHGGNVYSHPRSQLVDRSGPVETLGPSGMLIGTGITDCPTC